MEITAQKSFFLKEQSLSFLSSKCRENVSPQNSQVPLEKKENVLKRTP